jgi:hypothetical protein
MARRKWTILMVDDDADYAASLKPFFETQLGRVLWARTPSQAEKILSTEKIDLPDNCKNRIGWSEDAGNGCAKEYAHPACCFQQVYKISSEFCEQFDHGCRIMGLL